MLVNSCKQLPPELLGNLNTHYRSSSSAHPDIRIDVSPAGNHYLVVPYQEPWYRYALLVEISHRRLKILKEHGADLYPFFQEPENGYFFLATLNETGQIEELNQVKPEELPNVNWPVQDLHSIHFQATALHQKRLVDYAAKRKRVEIKVKFESPELDDNMKVWAFKNLLLPFTQLVEHALADHTCNIRQLEKKLNLGFTKIRHHCLEGILEFDYTPKLMDSSCSEIENLENLYLLFDSDNQRDIINNLNRFNDKKIIPEYTTLLRAVVRNNVKMTSQFATPDQKMKEIILTSQKAQKLKELVETKQLSETRQETVVGVLTKIDFESKTPTFTMHSICGQKYSGKIAEPMATKNKLQPFILCNKEYEFLLQVTYSSGAGLGREKFEYVLVGISEV